MRKLCFAVLFLSNTLFAQVGLDNTKKEIIHSPEKGMLSGKVTDAKTGLVLSGVSIVIPDLKSGTATDAAGEYALKNIAEGKHLIEVSHIGYTTLAEEVFINADMKKDFALSETVLENNAVVVTGVSRSTQLRKVPVSVSIVRKQDLLQSVSANLIESLTKTPGISSVGTGPAISKPVIRGLGYNRVVTINDGVRQEGNQWGDEHGIEIDDQSASKVEILRGPGAIIYGSDAMAGVINVITNVPIQEGTMKVNLLGNYQSNNNLNAWNANWAGNSNGFNWNVYGSTKAAADYRNKYDGKVFNSRFNEHNFGGYVGYNGGWGFSHILFSKFDQKLGIIEGTRDADGDFVKQMPGGLEQKVTDADFSDTDPVVPYQRIQHSKISTDNSINLGKNRLAFNVGLQRNQRQEFGNPDDPDEIGNYFDTKTLTYTAQFHFAEKAGWKTSIGGNGMHQDHKNPGLESLIPQYNLTDIGGYVYTQKEFKKIDLSAGIRYDSRDLNTQPLMDGSTLKVPSFKKTYSSVSGGIGLTAALTDQLSVKFNAARGFRAPAIPELASNGSHEGTNRYEYGDQNLKNETSLQFDGGLEFNIEHFSFIVSAFHNSFDNFIFYRKLAAAAGGDSIINVNGNNLTAFKFDQRQATLSGVELTLDFHPHPLDWLHIENTFSVVNGRFKDKIEYSNNIPFMPAPRILTTLRADVKKVEDNVRNFYFKIEFDNTFAQNNVFTVYNTESATSGYSLMNIGIGADFITKKELPLFSLYLSGNNITDVGYQNHLSRLKYTDYNSSNGRTGVFNMGRNFSIKLNVPFTVKIKK
ncbi:MAG: TonB-dependent receptor [Ferruginibacter sp.]